MDNLEDAGAGMPTPERIRSTAGLALTDPRGMSSQMLEGYFELSTTLGEMLHGWDPRPTNATFPTFATWTTETLRIDVVREAAKQPLGPRGLVSPGRWMYGWVADWVLGGDDVVARNLARGEAAIYQEIGLGIHALVTTVRDALRAGGPPDGDQAIPWWQDVWQRYTDTLVDESNALDNQRQDPDQPEPVGDTQRAVLQEAVLPYFQVLASGLTRLETDAAGQKKRAELILLGTIRLEAYAQTRLQPVLKRNLSYVPDALRAIVGSRLTGRTNRPTVALRRAYERSRKASALFDEAFEIAATRHVFGLVLGQEVLSLGRDLPLAPPANPVLRDRQPEGDLNRYKLGSFFPHDLQALREPDVWTAWQQFDRSTGEGSRTAVDDWLRYEERLNFIVNMFRSRQQLSALYNRPMSLRPAEPVPPGPPGPPAGPRLPAMLPRRTRLADVLPDVSDATKKRLASRVRGQG